MDWLQNLPNLWHLRRKKVNDRLDQAVHLRSLTCAPVLLRVMVVAAIAVDGYEETGDGEEREEERGNSCGGFTYGPSPEQRVWGGPGVRWTGQGKVRAHVENENGKSFSEDSDVRPIASGSPRTLGIDNKLPSSRTTVTQGHSPRIEAQQRSQVVWPRPVFAH